MPKTALIQNNKYDLLAIKCVHEMQATGVMKKFAALLGREDVDKSVCLYCLNIAPTESTALFEFLSQIENLHMLKISGCNIEHFATHKLAELLLTSVNCKLTRLDISKNNLTDKSSRSLSEALKNGNCKLTELKISDNNLTDESCR